MNEHTPETLRAAFAGATEAILPPGSMTPESAERVANTYANAWEVEQRLCQEYQAGLSQAQRGIEIAAAKWKALRKRIEALEREVATAIEENERLELFKTVLGWIAETNPIGLHGYVMGHHALEPISDLPTFLRAFPSVDLDGWLAKHGCAMDAAKAQADAALAQEKPG